VLKGSEAPIVPCKYVDWPYFEKLNDPYYNAAMEICKEFGLYDIMGFGTIGTPRSLHSFTPPCTMMHIGSLSIGPLRERSMALIT
jgi:hypothetical protein